MEASQENILASIKKIVTQICGEPRHGFKLETRLSEDLGADSLDEVELIMKVEKYYNVSIPDEEISYIRTVGDIVLYLDTKLKGQRTKKLLEYK